MGDVVGETVEFQGANYTAVREGRARILTPYRDPTSAQDTHKTSRNNNNNIGVQSVFYNRIQQFNRDLSVLAILVHGEGAVAEKEARFQKNLGNAKIKKDRRKEKQIAEQHSSHGGEDAEAASGSAGSHQIEHGVSTTANSATESGKGPMSTAKRKRNENPDGDDHMNGDEDHVPSKKSRQEDPSPPLKDEPHFKQETDPLQTQSSITDLSTKQHKVKYSILDALSATGLRALRYAKEIPFVTKVIANDLLPEAVRSIEKNVQYNKVEEIITAHQDDARTYMYGRSGKELPHAHGESYVHRFDVIDLDPYGTAAPFFDSALQALQDGGLLCVTCTDAGVFASNGYPEKAYALYSGTTMKGVHSHEAGLRLILHAISLSAARYGIAIEPLLSLSIDFYARLFIRIHKRPHEVKLLSGTSMLTYNCDQGCGAWKVQRIGRNIVKQNKVGDVFFSHGYAQGPSAGPNCDHCGFKTHLAGPMWAGPLHNPFFIRAILAKLPSLDKEVYGTVDRIEGMLKTAIEEDYYAKLKSTSDESKSEALQEKQPSGLIPRLSPEREDPMPFFFVPTFLAKVLHTITPSEAALRSAFLSLGYHVTRSHCKPGSLKTNAPWSVIWEIFREWVRKESPQREGALKEGTAGYAIMKRARGTESAKVLSFKDELRERLSKVSRVDDLKAEMEAAMFRIEQLQAQAQGVEGSMTNGHGEEAVTGLDNEAAVPERAPHKLNIIFDEKLGKENKEKLMRYQINMPHWGPMNRATGQAN